MAEDRKPARGKTPIAWHPLFPAIVALWFGALFGLGTLAIRTALLESLALASHIDRIVPAAAPPLGTNARILIAVMLALLGGVIGAAIGMLMARSKPAAVRRRAEAAEAKAARAEAKAAAVVTTPEPESVAAADAPNFIDISALDLDDDMKIEAEIFAAAEPAGEPAIEPESEAELLAEAQPARASARTFERPLDPASFPLPELFPPPGGAAAARLTAATLDSLSHVELIERLALSLQKRREEAEDATALGASDTYANTDFAPLAQTEARAQPLQAPSYYPPAPEPATPRFAALPAAFEPDESGDETGGAEETAAGSYSSLLGIGRPALSDTSKPVALFPEQPAEPTAASQQNSVATERALRDALATLQRMSGAA